MKKVLRIILPILLCLAIIACTCWYLFVYDRAFTRDILLKCARYSESQGSHAVAEWFYTCAYTQSGNSDAVACELAEQYKSVGNYTKAEYTLTNAIIDGGGVDLYIALSKTYVEQDKLLDAVNMLNGVTNEEIKAQLDAIRPQAPTVTPAPGFYNQYISVTVQGEGGTLYVNADAQFPSVKADPYSEPIPLKDGESTVYAVTVAENGLVSPAAVYGYTIGGVVEVMDFKDAEMEAAVRELLIVSDTKVLYTNDLWTIKEFTVPESAKDYSALKNMVFLEKLTISGGVAGQLHNIAALSTLSELTVTGITVTQEELSAISTLPSLKKLTLAGCDLAGIAPLANASGITHLDLHGNTVRKLDALSGMTALEVLILEDNAVVDLSALTGCTALSKLDVSGNSITSLAPVAGLSALTWLDAGNNLITELGAVNRLTALEYLNLKSNSLTTVDGISGCTKLTELNIASNSLTDVSSLSSLVDLMYFDFSYNQVKELPAFPKDCALVVINGSNNQITSLERLKGLENLNNVHMDYNTEISSVSPLESCPVLIEVNVYATKVKDVTALTNQSIIVNYNPVQ